MSFRKELEEARRKAQEEVYQRDVLPRLQVEEETDKLRRDQEEEYRRLSMERGEEIDRYLKPVKGMADSLIRELAMATWGYIGWGYPGYGTWFGKNMDRLDDPKLATWIVGRTYLRDRRDATKQRQWSTEVGPKGDEYERKLARKTGTTWADGSETYTIFLMNEENSLFFASQSDRTGGTSEQEFKELLKRYFVKGPDRVYMASNNSWPSDSHSPDV